MITAASIHWLAGLLEGEACFHKRKRCPRITLGMTDEDVICRAASLLGGKVNKRNARGTNLKGSRTHFKPLYVVYVNGRKAAGWAMTLYPLMGERRRVRIRELLSLWRTSRRRVVEDGHCLIHPEGEIFRYGKNGGRGCRVCCNERRAASYL